MGQQMTTGRLARWSRPGSDRGAAMVLVMALMIFIMGVTVAVAGIVVGQSPAVFQAERGSQTIYAAQSGLQVALGQIRSAATGSFGDRTKLPCSIDGKVGGDDSAGYEVQIRYFMVDPSGMTTAQRSAATSYSCTTLPGTPYYALLTATGTGHSVAGLPDDVANRTLEAVYTFKVTNVNIPGGPIYSYGGGNCMYADYSTATPAAGTKIRFASSTSTSCSATDTNAKKKNSWVYDTDWKIKLASTIGTASVLCISGPWSGTSTQDAQLQPCTTGTNIYKQLWSWTGDYSWRGKLTAAATTLTTCLAPTSESPWTTGYLQVRASDCTGDFSPSAAVGAGAASKATNQIVNYKEFGRCMDVTGADINATYQIAYPCKQDPYTGGAGILWNHKWYYAEPTTGNVSTAPQQIRVTTDGGTNYCLETPTSGSYPTFKICNASQARQKWVRYGDTGSYATSYLFTDNSGRCIAVNPADTFNGWSKLVVTACNGGLEQKWNAPSVANDSTLGSYKELG